MYTWCRPSWLTMAWPPKIFRFCKKHTTKLAYIAITYEIQKPIIYGNTYSLVHMGRITGIGPQVIFLSLSSQVRPDRFDRERMGSSGDDSSPRNDPKVTIRRFARAATGKSRQLDPRNPWWDVSLSSAFPSLQIMGLFHWPFLSSFRIPPVDYSTIMRTSRRRSWMRRPRPLSRALSIAYLFYGGFIHTSHTPSSRGRVCHPLSMPLDCFTLPQTVG